MTRPSPSLRTGPARALRRDRRVVLTSRQPAVGGRAPAARTKALSPTQILERIGQRLDLLKGGRDSDPRQQTLRATIEWSHELLSDAEQTLFRRLAVFAGGSTLVAAEAIADAELDTLQSLVEKSLVRFSAGRFWMLETIRHSGRAARQAWAKQSGSINPRCTTRPTGD